MEVVQQVAFWVEDQEVFKSMSRKSVCTYTVSKHEGYLHSSLCELASSKRVANNLSKKIKESQMKCLC